MANFPNTVTSFATRSNGQTIDASHIQGLQDEVSAIEDGYLNGTARLNSSNSTVVNLSVTGNSTIAGTLTVNGQAVNGRMPGARVVNTVDQAVGNAAWTGLSWDTEVYDSTGIHDTGSNSSRMTLTSSGLWMFGAQVTWRIGSTVGDRFFRVKVNDSSGVAGVSAIGRVSAGSTAATQQVQGLYYATDTASYLTALVYQNTGSTGSIAAAPGSEATDLGRAHFWVQKVSH